MTSGLAGRTALVTGASRGIGAAIAERLAAEGAHVVLVARDAAALEAVEQRIHEAGGSATIAPLDLAADDGVARLAAAVATRWKALDLLVLNAATLGSLTPVDKIDGAEFARLVTVNLLANQALIAAFDPLLRSSDKAEVIGLTSSVAATPRAFWGAYGATKAALDTLLGAYAQETGHTGKLRVLIADPGATRTAMRAQAFPGEDPAALKPPAMVADALIALLASDAPSGSRVRLEFRNEAE